LATGGKIFIKPPPTSSENGKINYIGYPTPLFNHSVIGGFPDTAEYAVVLGSAIRLLQYRINKYLHEDEDVELAQSAQKELGIIVSMYSQELQRLTGQPMAQQQGEQV